MIYVIRFTNKPDCFVTGLTFLLFGFEGEDELDLYGNIETLGGQLVPNSFKGIPDFAVVPLYGVQLKHTVNEIVTDLFIVSDSNHLEIVFYLTCDQDNRTINWYRVNKSFHANEIRHLIPHRRTA